MIIWIKKMGCYRWFLREILCEETRKEIKVLYIRIHFLPRWKNYKTWSNKVGYKENLIEHTVMMWKVRHIGLPIKCIDLEKVKSIQLTLNVFSWDLKKNKYILIFKWDIEWKKVEKQNINFKNNKKIASEKRASNWNCTKWCWKQNYSRLYVGNTISILIFLTYLILKPVKIDTRLERRQLPQGRFIGRTQNCIILQMQWIQQCLHFVQIFRNVEILLQSIDIEFRSQIQNVVNTFVMIAQD